MSDEKLYGPYRSRWGHETMFSVGRSGSPYPRCNPRKENEVSQAPSGRREWGEWTYVGPELGRHPSDPDNGIIWQ